LKRTKAQIRAEQSKREQSSKHEKRVERKLNRLVPNSGAGRIKGDIQNPDELIEHKFTDKDQFILKTSMLKKTESQAEKAGKIPVWIITIKGQDYILRRFL